MTEKTPPALVFQDATLAYPHNGNTLWALAGLTATIPFGAVTGIVGPNGAGKTTLLKIASGLVHLTTGTITLSDRALGDWNRDELARTLAYLPQGGDAAWPIAVRDLVALGRMPHNASLHALGRKDRAAIDRAMARADVNGFADRRVDRLSAGERSRVLFARALATEADILLCDEPAAYLDPKHQLRLMALLAEEAVRGAAVIVTLHELALAARCDHLLVLDKGRVAAHGPAEEALSDRVLAEVFGIEVRRATDSRVPIPWSLV